MLCIKVTHNVSGLGDVGIFYNRKMSFIMQLNSEIKDEHLGSSPNIANAMLGDGAGNMWYDLQDLDGEIWASCSEFDGYYEVSNLGRIKSIERLVYGSWGSSYLLKSRILKAAIKKKNKASKYYFIHISIDGKRYTREVHRLVAQEFVDGDKKLMVVHINHNTLDNMATNLKYATCQEKSQQAWDMGNQISFAKGKFGGNAIGAKPITALTMGGDKVKEFCSRIEAVDWLIKNGTARVQPKVNIISAINKAAKGITRFSYGYKWKDGSRIA